jgi:hypothetical protein
MTSVNNILSIQPTYSAPTPAAVSPPPATSDLTPDTTTPAAPPAPEQTAEQASSGAYTAVANVNASTIRGANLNIQA